MENIIKEQTKANLDTYTAEEIMAILKIGETTAYTLIRDAYKNNKYFKVLKVGKLYRIPKQSFDNWFVQ